MSLYVEVGPPREAGVDLERSLARTLAGIREARIVIDQSSSRIAPSCSVT
jgi:hypothetical protein